MTTPHQAAAAIRARAASVAPRVGLVLGSGLAGLADAIEAPTVIEYTDIPGFPKPRVEAHVGRLVLGGLGGVDVACLQGRVHLYEGARGADIKLYVRMLKLLGCDTLVLTNAAGSLRHAMGPGSLMMFADHINLQPFNPLAGANDEEFGPRFPAMGAAYDPELRALLRGAAAGLGLTLHEGVYLALLGPSFETPAEIRAYATLGADAVGMSTVPETIVARHCGLRVAAVSVITNLAVGLTDQPLSHAQTLGEATKAAADLQRLLTAFLGRLPAAG